MVEFNKLQEVASLLNQKSDLINETLKHIQNQLATINLGVEVWLEKDPLFKDLIECDAGEENEKKIWKEVSLGYGKYLDQWGLYVRTTHIKEAKGFAGFPHFEIIWSGKPKLLLEDSRKVRIKALSKIESLYNALMKEAEESIRVIDNAAEIAEKVSAGVKVEKPRALGLPISQEDQPRRGLRTPPEVIRKLKEEGKI